jgi:hypothetical protein
VEILIGASCTWSTEFDVATSFLLGFLKGILSACLNFSVLLLWPVTAVLRVIMFQVDHEF